MSSIEEKLSTIREIQQSLSELQNHLQENQNSIWSELSRMKQSWNDSQMEKFKSSDYWGSFNANLVSLMARIEKAKGFLENKYSTLSSHRN